LVKRDEVGFGVSRRRVLQLLGLGAASAIGGLELPAWAAQAGGRAVTFPKGAVIRTILKDIAPESVTGATLFHEHMSMSRAYWDQITAGMPENVRKQLAEPAGSRYFAEDLDLIIGEMKAARQDGVGCVVDGGHADMGRSVGFLREASSRSGMPIVASGGYYTQPFHPPDLERRSEDQIADELVRDAAAERWGAYGEIASSEKVFRAIGKAHVRNNLPIFTHNTGTHHALEQIDIFESVGVKPDRFVVGHIGDAVDDLTGGIQKAICKRGAYVGFDRRMGERQATIVKALVDAGYADKVLVSSDFAIARDTKARGGPGYGRVVTQYGPTMQKAGVPEAVVRAILVDNPRRFLAFVPRKSS
jgi:phosphotriesterase-related protein